jgi:hypothetical protein
MTMIEIDVCIPIIAAIIGIGYPIFLQVLTNLEDKYNSHLIGELFKSEPERNFLNFSIIASLVSALLVLINRPPWFDFGIFNIIVDNSAVLLLILFTIILVIGFFLFVKKILIYNSKLRFINYLIQKHSKSKDKPRIFRAISDLLYYSIRIQDSELAHVISRFIYDRFADQREISKSKTIEYTTEYYELAYKATEELAIINNNRLLFLEARSAGAIWLLGEKKDYEISETTYKWLWYNISIPVKYNKDNMIMSFWETANQYFSYNLPVITPEYSNGNLSNQDKINERDKSRKRFLEFTHALGGLLLYKKKYSCISRIFKYTNSIPPKYELLPSNMDQIMELYINYRDPYEDNYPWITVKYNYPELDGITADYIIKKWICAYIAVLLIRQYTLVAHYIYEKPLEPPTTPKTQRDKRIWIDNLDFFKDLIKDNLNNSELIEILNFNFITDSWCDNNSIQCPTEFIENLKKDVVLKYKEQEAEQEISQDLVNNFYDSTKKQITSALEKYHPIKNSDKIESDYKELFIIGDRAIVEKSSYALDQESENLNYDSFLAESISNKIHRGMSEIIYFMKNKTYLIEQKDMFTAIDKLNIDPQEYIILNYENYLPYFINDLKIPNLQTDNYNSLKIFSFEQYHFSLIGESFFIVKKADLPNIEYLDISEEEVKKYSLKLLDETCKIYGSVLPLNKHKDLQQDFLKQTDEETLNKSVLINIEIKNKIRWRRNSEVVQIKSFSRYGQKGSPSDLKDITPIKK